MPIPDYQSIMLPILKLISDRQEYSNKELVKKVAAHFSMTDKEQSEMLPSQRQSVLSNRVAWAIAYLKKAGLITSPRRGIQTLTLRGKQALAQRPETINNSFLMQYPEFCDFVGKEKSSDSVLINGIIRPIEVRTPQEIMAESYREINSALASELIEQILHLPPGFFERLVLDLLLAMNYGGSPEDAAQVVGKSGDEGIDGIIKQDRLGLDIIYVQAKRWKENVGGPIVQAFIGALHLRSAQRGILITTSCFTSQAKELAAKSATRVILIDGILLAQLMIEHNIGVAIETEYKLKRIDTDYFADDTA